MRKGKNMHIILGVLLIIIGMIVSYCVMINGTDEKMRQKAYETLDANAEQRASLIKNNLENQCKISKNMAVFLNNNKMNDDEIISLLEKNEESSEATGIEYARLDGTVLGLEGYNISNCEYFKKSSNGDLAIEIVDAFYNENNVVIISSPVYKNDKVEAILISYYNAENMNEILLGEEREENTFFTIFDSYGEIVSTTNSEFSNVKKSMSFFNEVTFENNYSYSELNEEMKIGNFGSFIYDYQNKSSVISFYPVRMSTLPNDIWYVFEGVSLDIIEQDILMEKRWARNISFLLFGFGILAVGMFMAAEKINEKKIKKNNEELLIKERSFRIIVHQSGRFVTEYDILQKKMILEPTGQDIFADELATKKKISIEDIIKKGYVADDSIENYRRFFKMLEMGNMNVVMDIQLKVRTGEYRWYRHNGSLLVNDKHLPIMAVISVYDCTEQIAAEDNYNQWIEKIDYMPTTKYALFECNLSKDIVLKGSGELIFKYKGMDNGKINERALAYASAKLFEDDKNTFISFLNRERIFGLYRDGILHNELEYRENSENGIIRWVKVETQAIKYTDIDDVKLCVLFIDIDEEKRLELAKKERYDYDYLTGVYNRVAFINKVTEYIEKNSNENHAILMIDIDGFKRVNDFGGHNVGDEVLKEFAKSARTFIKNDEIFGRVGGDEFMLLIPNISFDAAISKRAKEICSGLSRKLKNGILLSVSIGISVYKRDGKSFDELYHKADTALFYIKKIAKNSYSFYNETMSKIDINNNVNKQTFDYNVGKIIVVSDNQGLLDVANNELIQKYEIVKATRLEEVEISYRKYTSDIELLIIDTTCKLGKEIMKNHELYRDINDVPNLMIIDEYKNNLVMDVIKNGANAILSKPLEKDILLIQIENLIKQRQVNITKIQNGYSMLQNSEEQRYHDVLEATKTAIFIYDVKTNVYIVDAHVNEIISGNFDGRKLSEVAIDEHLAIRNDIRKAEKIIRLVAIGETDSVEMNILFKSASGQMRWFKLQAIKMKNQEINQNRILITLNDVHEEVKANELLKFRAERDMLTGLYNRESFLELTAAYVNGKEQGDYILSCLDIDGFKVINDQNGIEEGDRILKATAKILRKKMEEVNGLAGRISGDTFILLYPTSNDNLDIISELSANINYGLKKTPVIFSCGKYIINDPNISVSSMLDRTIIAKKSVKGLYDKHVAYFDEKMRNDILIEQEIVSEMDHAMNNNEFKVWYQPQYNHETKCLIGAEALVRWIHPFKKMIYPNVFIPIFEKNGFIYELDKFVWEEACKNLRYWLDNNQKPLPISVNVSRLDLFKEDFYDFLIGLYEKYQIPYDLLRVEITESAFANSTSYIIDIVKKIKEKGIIVEIDDFGNGYSSLNVLKDVPADILKLDMRFLDDSSDTNKGGNITESVVRMAKWIGMSVIAEGVETKEQADYLLSIGCHWIQGYFYAKPMSKEDYETLMKQSKKEVQTLALETIKTFDNNKFWDPNSVDTLVFNSYVGGAAVIEFFDNRLELLKVNENYLATIGKEFITENYMVESPCGKIDDNQYQIVLSAFQKAITENCEVTYETIRHSVKDEEKVAYIKTTIRLIAQTTKRYMFYAKVENVTEQREIEKVVLETTEQLEFLNRVTTELLIEDNANLAIANVLNQMMKYFMGDSAYLLEGDSADDYMNQTCMVYSDSDIHTNDDNIVVKTEDISSFIDSFKEKNFVYYEDISLLNAQQYQVLKKHPKLRSLIIIKVSNNKKIMGFIGIINPKYKLSTFDNLEVLGKYMMVIINRRNINNRLQEENYALNHMMRDTPAGFVLMKSTKENKLFPIYVNQPFAEMTGMSVKEVFEKYKDDAYWGVHPDDLDRVKKIIENAKRSNNSYVCDYRLYHHTKGYVWFKTSGFVTKNKDGTYNINACYIDISQEKENENIRENVLDNIPCGAGLYEYNKGIIKVLYVNKSYLVMMGQKDIGFTGEDTIKTVHPDDREKIYNSIMKGIKDKDDVTVDIRLINGNNEYELIRIKGHIIKMTSETVLIYATFTKISDYENHEKILLSTAIEAVMNISNDLSFVKDRTLSYVCGTKEFAKMVGISNVNEIIGKNDYDLFDNDLANKYIKDDRMILESGSSIVNEIEEIPGNEYSSTSKYPLYDDKGNIIGIYGIGVRVKNKKTYSNGQNDNI